MRLARVGLKKTKVVRRVPRRQDQVFRRRKTGEESAVEQDRKQEEGREGPRGEVRGARRSRWGVGLHRREFSEYGGGY